METETKIVISFVLVWNCRRRLHPKMESRYGAAQMPLGRSRDASAAVSIPEVAIQNDVLDAVRFSRPNQQSRYGAHILSGRYSLKVSAFSSDGFDAHRPSASKCLAQRQPVYFGGLELVTGALQLRALSEARRLNQRFQHCALPQRFRY